MPLSDPNCTTLAGLLSTGLDSCFPAARPQIRDSLLALKALVCWPVQSVYLTRSSGQVLAGSIYTKILWDGETYDPASLYTPPTGDIVIAVTGLYTVTASLTWIPVADNDQLTVAININGTPKVRNTVSAALSGRQQFISVALTMAITQADIVTIAAEYFHPADPDQNVALATGNTFFMDMLQPL